MAGNGTGGPWGNGGNRGSEIMVVAVIAHLQAVVKAPI